MFISFRISRQPASYYRGRPLRVEQLEIRRLLDADGLSVEVEGLSVGGEILWADDRRRDSPSDPQIEVLAQEASPAEPSQSMSIDDGSMLDTVEARADHGNTLDANTEEINTAQVAEIAQNFPTSVTVTSPATLPILAGDYDADADVDGADLLEWQRSLAENIDLSADGNQDGVVDAGDLQVWQDQFAVPTNPIATVSGISGDFNGNSQVTGADFLLWQTSLGSTSQLAADANANGVVDQDDLEIWKQDFATVGLSATGGLLDYYRSIFDQTYDLSHSTYNTIADSGWGPLYYNFQYVLGGTLSMFEATRDLTYLERALTWAETMVSKATIVDFDNKLNWSGNWLISSNYADEGIASLLEDAQGATELAHLARLIITDPELYLSYGTRATAIYEFVRDHIVEKSLWDRRQLYWHFGRASNESLPFTDRNALLISTMVDLKLANNVLQINDRVKNEYQEIIDELASGFKARLVHAAADPDCDSFGSSTSALIYDCGLHNLNLPDHADDTSHANRAITMVVDLYEAGMLIERSDVEGLAQLLNDVIWDGSLTSPQFTNHIDGNNDPNLGRGPFGLGVIYSGWVRLAQYNSTTLAIFDATLRAMNDGIRNPSLDVMANFNGMSAIPGHLAIAVTQPAAPYEEGGGEIAPAPNMALIHGPLQPTEQFADSQTASPTWNDGQPHPMGQGGIPKVVETSSYSAESGLPSELVDAAIALATAPEPDSEPNLSTGAERTSEPFLVVDSQPQHTAIDSIASDIARANQFHLPNEKLSLDAIKLTVDDSVESSFPQLQRSNSSSRR